MKKIIDAQTFQNMLFRSEDEYSPQAGVIETLYYQGKDSNILAIDYVTSSIRSWLHEDFFDTAFTENQKSKIRTTLLDNSAFEIDDARYNSEATNDKIFLLSRREIENQNYGFNPRGREKDSARTACGTDYAYCQGFGYLDFWWERTASNSYKSYVVFSDYGNSNMEFDVNMTGGVRPACCLSDLSDDTEVSQLLYSTQGDGQVLSPNSASPIGAGKVQKSSKSSDRKAIFVLVAVGVVVAALALALILLVKKSKKPPVPNQSPRYR
ncbi:MAG: hypothetical protein IKN72_09370 [Clostridia bacterium]|nr:hypothetical protein [Clostridia bacterium]